MATFALTVIFGKGEFRLFETARGFAVAHGTVEVVEFRTPLDLFTRIRGEDQRRC